MLVIEFNNKLELVALKNNDLTYAKWRNEKDFDGKGAVKTVNEEEWEIYCQKERYKLACLKVAKTL